MDKDVHLISKTGERLAIPHKVFNDSDMMKDGKYDEYDLDVDWYLANGYCKAEDMFRRIESGYGLISREEINNNEWLTIDEAKEETIKAISKEYEEDNVFAGAWVS